MNCSNYYLSHDMSSLNEWQGCGIQLVQDGLEAIRRNAPSSAQALEWLDQLSETVRTISAQAFEKMEANGESWKNDTSGLREWILLGVAATFLVITAVSLGSILRKAPADSSIKTNEEEPNVGNIEQGQA